MWAKHPSDKAKAVVLFYLIVATDVSSNGSVGYLMQKRINYVTELNVISLTARPKGF